MLAVEQSTSYYSDKLTRLPVATNSAPSIAPVAEKAQHEPH